MCYGVQGVGRQSQGTPPRRGFTLVELLVVILIILLISAVALSTIGPAYGRRQNSEAGRILQGAIVGARDDAIHRNQASGIRLLPDPTYPLTYLPNGQIDPTKILAYNRIIPIAAAPNYSEGALSIFTDGAGGSTNYAPAIRTVNGQVDVPCLVLEGAPFSKAGAPNPPTSWFWNIRVGDKIQVGNAGPWYTIVGPMVVGPASGSNSEMFVNVGLPGAALPTLVGGLPCEYLLLVNGVDDNKNGFVDEGYDGVDNNGVNGVDELAEWEIERWLGAIGN